MRLERYSSNLGRLIESPADGVCGRSRLKGYGEPVRETEIRHRSRTRVLCAAAHEAARSHCVDTVRALVAAMAALRAIRSRVKARPNRLRRRVSAPAYLPALSKIRRFQPHKRLIRIGLFALVWGLSFEAAADKYALLIGVSTYDYAAVKTGVIPLNYPSFDVEALEISLRDKGYKVIPLIDDNARRQHILTAFMKLRDEVKPDDLFLLFFAGHGLRDSAIEQTYWLTYDTKLDLLDNNGIRLSHLMDYVEDIKAGKKLILLDHCFSGDVVFDGTQPGEARRAAGAAPRIVREGTRGVVPIEDIETVVDRGDGGMIVLAAARNEAYEHAEYGNGLLTEAGLGAIESRDADSGTRDGKLSVYELTSYVRDRLKELSQRIGVTQEPVLKVNAQDVDQWILLDLPAVGPTPQELRQQYRQRLAKWATQAPPWIEMSVKLAAYGVLQRWVDSVQANRPLAIKDEIAVRVLRDNMDALEIEDVPEASVAEAVNNELKLVLEIQ